MKAKHLMCWFAVWTVGAGSAMAQAPQPLTASQLSQTVVGKKVEHLRLSDNRVFIWDVRDSGTLYLQNTNVKAKWSLSDQGEFCVKWSVAQIPDQCYFFYDQNGLVAGPSSTPGVFTSQVRSVK